MSRIGKRELEIPTGVTVTVNENVVNVKGAKGELKLDLVKGMNVMIEENKNMLYVNILDVLDVEDHMQY